MNALEHNIATARGESLAAMVLASSALQAVYSILPKEIREDMHKRMSEFIDRTLNMSGPGKGDANDEFNSKMREVARFHTNQTMDAIERMLRSAPPTRG